MPKTEGCTCIFVCDKMLCWEANVICRERCEKKKVKYYSFRLLAENESNGVLLHWKKHSEKPGKEISECRINKGKQMESKVYGKYYIHSLMNDSSNGEQHTASFSSRAFLPLVQLVPIKCYIFKLGHVENAITVFPAQNTACIYWLKLATDKKKNC